MCHDPFDVDWHAIMVISFLFFAAQKYLIQGIFPTELKG